MKFGRWRLVKDDDHHFHYERRWRRQRYSRRMKRGLRSTGQVIYVAVMIVVSIIDLVIQVALFVNGEIGWAVVYLFFGWAVTLTIGHWIGMLLAAPFAIAGYEKE